jgi:hypothetical protein
MINLQINPIVLQTLKTHFPTPKNSAVRALDKYIKLLTQQLTTSVMHGRNAWMQSKNLYSISVHKQSNRGSQIGHDKIRLHKWLVQNKLELFTVVELGSNMSKKLSVVKLTDLVTVTHTDTHVKSHNDQETDYLNELLLHQALSNKELFNTLYPNVADLSEQEINDTYDIVPIDITSLKNYVAWLKHESKFLSVSQKEQRLVQADTILRVAQHTKGS